MNNEIKVINLKDSENEPDKRVKPARPIFKTSKITSGQGDDNSDDDDDDHVGKVPGISKSKFDKVPGVRTVRFVSIYIRFYRIICCCLICCWYRIIHVTSNKVFCSTNFPTL